MADALREQEPDALNEISMKTNSVMLRPRTRINRHVFLPPQSRLQTTSPVSWLQANAKVHVIRSWIGRSRR